MFLCNKCHANCPTASLEMRSEGPCELCKKHAVCTDCQHYKEIEETLPFDPAQITGYFLAMEEDGNLVAWADESCAYIAAFSTKEKLESFAVDYGLKYAMMDVIGDGRAYLQNAPRKLAGRPLVLVFDPIVDKEADGIRCQRFIRRDN